MIALPAGWDAVLGEHAAPDSCHPQDASCWRLTQEGRTVLFDAGGGLGPLPPTPDLLVLTHGHADHSGGAARLVAAGARAMASPLTSDWLARGDETAISLDRARAAKVYPADYRLVPCLGVNAAPAGMRVTFGSATIAAVPTPGHSDDHTSWLVNVSGRRTLVGGDAVFAGGTVVLQDTWDCSVERTCATIRLLAALAPDDILPGHGPPLIGAAAEAALGAALARVNRLLPPNMFI